MKHGAQPHRPSGFTLVEILVVLAVIGILAGLLLPALARSRERGLGIVCLQNTRQLSLATQLYSDDHNGALPYNLGLSGDPLTAYRNNRNWVNDVMTWDLSPDNTNTQVITEAALGAYVSGNYRVYHCPSDRALSGVQTEAGWSQRLRSYSMNALMGNPGAYLTNGANLNDPHYRQFLKSDQITQAAELFVFLDEHPDSIDDGYFVNKETAPSYGSSGYNASTATTLEWTDLPASYHNQASAMVFADGHGSLHRWQVGGTIRPPVFHGANLPLPVQTDNVDFQWIMEHMSIRR